MTDTRKSFRFEAMPWACEPKDWMICQPVASPSSTAFIRPEQSFLDAINRFETNRVNGEDSYIKLFRRRSGLPTDLPLASDEDVAATDFALYYSLLMAYTLLDLLTTRQSSSNVQNKDSYLEKRIELDQLVIIYSTDPLRRLIVRRIWRKNSRIGFNVFLTSKLNCRTSKGWKIQNSRLEHQSQDTCPSLCVGPRSLTPSLEACSTSAWPPSIFTTSSRVTSILQRSKTQFLNWTRRLPRSIVIFVTYNIQHSIPDVKEWFMGYQTGNFKNPLHIALSISPILLFINVNMFNKSIGRLWLSKVCVLVYSVLHISTVSPGLEDGWTAKAWGHS